MTSDRATSSRSPSAYVEWLRLEWDRVGAWVLVVAGVVLLLVGYFKVSGTVYPAEQLPYVISAGVGGLFALGLGCTLWLSADLRDEWRKLDRIESSINAGGRPDLTGAGPTNHSVNSTETIRPRRAATAGVGASTGAGRRRRSTANDVASNSDPGVQSGE